MRLGYEAPMNALPSFGTFLIIVGAAFVLAVIFTGVQEVTKALDMEIPYGRIAILAVVMLFLCVGYVKGLQAISGSLNPTSIIEQQQLEAMSHKAPTP